MGHKEKEELLLSSLGSEEENEEEHNFLNQNLNNIPYNQWNNEKNYGFYEQQLQKQKNIDLKRHSHQFYIHTKDPRSKASSPIAFLCQNESDLYQNRGLLLRICII